MSSANSVRCKKTLKLHNRNHRAPNCCCGGFHFYLCATFSSSKAKHTCFHRNVGMCRTQSTCYKVDVIKNLFLRACVRDEQSATFIGGCSLFGAALRQTVRHRSSTTVSKPLFISVLGERGEEEKPIHVECHGPQNSQTLGSAGCP